MYLCFKHKIMKRNRLLCFFTFMVLCFYSTAQNLVPNYSFESITNCIAGEGEFNGYVADWTGQMAQGWLSYYTHQCSGDSSNGGSVPYNIGGFQYAHSGTSYVSIITFANGTDSTYPNPNTIYKDQRCYLQTELKDSLVAGRKYFVTFYMNLLNVCDYSCNDIGIYFSNIPPSFNNNGNVLSSYTPQVANNSKKKELNDTLNWMKISGNFIASGGEKYITIGNFKNDSMSSLNYLGEVTASGTVAWYYIDDVIVSPDSNYADSLFSSVPAISEPKEQIVIFPNPSTGRVQVSNLKSQVLNLEVYTILGEKILTTAITAENTSFDLSNYAKGIYFYRLTSKQGSLIQNGKLLL